MFALCRFSSLGIRHSVKHLKTLPLEPCVILPNQLRERSNFHTGVVRLDMETAVRSIGCGLAAIGCGAAAGGLGNVFGNLTNAVARNPSLKNQLFQFAIIGGALCEALGLFAFIMGMLSLYA